MAAQAAIDGLQGPDDRLRPRGSTPRFRQLQDALDERYLGPVTAAQAKLADARFAAYGDTLYPDATFTLRISYGKVMGWTERGRRCRPSPRWAGPTTGRPAPIPFDLPPAFVTSADAGSTRRSSMISSPPTTSSAAIRARP